MDRKLYSLCAQDGRRHYSPHVWKVALAIRLKQLEFQWVPLSFRGIGAIADGRFSSVPVLEEDGQFYCDSLKIASHLDQAHPDTPRLLPLGVSRIQAIFLSWYCDNILHPPLALLLSVPMYGMMDAEDRRYFRNKRERAFGKSLEKIGEESQGKEPEVLQKLEPFRAVLAESQWIGGDDPDFADCILFGSLQWCLTCRADFPFQPDDPVMLWRRRCLDIVGTHI